MHDDSTFKRLIDEARETVRFRFDGRDLAAPEGVSVAAALLENGVVALRATPVGGRSRGPFCMMGVCFDCLVEIDGVPNRQACMTEIAEGMELRPMHGARTRPEETSGD